MTDTRKACEQWQIESGENYADGTFDESYFLPFDAGYKACQSLNDKRIENYKSAYETWQDKTEWVQETSTAKELGLHRADVLKKRIEQLLAVIAKKDALINQCIENNLGLADGDICTLKPIKEALALQPSDVELVEVGYFAASSRHGIELNFYNDDTNEVLDSPLLYTIKTKADTK